MSDFDFDRARKRMVSDQLVKRGLSDLRVLAAMRLVPRELFVPPELHERAYDDEPLPIGDHHFWIRVETRRTPLEGDWKGIESAVEASLARDPVADAEFVHWKLQMEGRYPIDLGPLWSLIGAAK